MYIRMLTGGRKGEVQEVKFHIAKELIAQKRAEKIDFDALPQERVITFDALNNKPSMTVTPPDKKRRAKSKWSISGSRTGRTSSRLHSPR